MSEENVVKQICDIYEQMEITNPIYWSISYYAYSKMKTSLTVKPLFQLLETDFSPCKNERAQLINALLEQVNGFIEFYILYI